MTTENTNCPTCGSAVIAHLPTSDGGTGYFEPVTNRLCADLAASLAQVKELEWKPIETAPKDRKVLLWGKYWSDEMGFFPHPLIGMWSQNQDRWETNFNCGCRPTHWTELPAAPQGEGE